MFGATASLSATRFNRAGKVVPLPPSPTKRSGEGSDGDGDSGGGGGGGSFGQGSSGGRGKQRISSLRNMGGFDDDEYEQQPPAGVDDSLLFGEYVPPMSLDDELSLNNLLDSK